MALTIAGFIARTQGELERALELDERALAVRRRVFGEVHPLVAESLEKVALDRLEGPDPASAVAQIRRAVELRQRLHPAGHPSIGLVRIELSKALRAAGEYKEAASEANAAVELLTATLAADDVRLYAPRLYAGMAAIEVDTFAVAAAHLEHARALGDAAKLTAFDWAELEFAIARAESKDARSPQAVAAATAARARLDRDDRAHAKLAAQIDGWLGSSP